MPENPDSSAADQRALQAEMDFTRLFNLSLDLLCIAGLDGYFRRVNPSWTRVLGWTEAELLARPVADFMHPEDRERTLQARAGLARGMPVSGLENRYRCKDGTYRWLSWQSVAEPGEATVFCVARDITERRRLEHEHLVSSKLESAGILAGGLAHDFNNLLASLALNLDMVSLAGLTNDEQAQHLRDARRTVQTAKSLTDQLITLAKGSAPQREICDLQKVLRASAEFALIGSGLHYECRFAPGLWPAEVDLGQIGQVVCGLLLNAREATPAGGSVVLEATNVSLRAGEVNGLAAGDWVRLRVIDTGGGIPPEVMPKVFDPYFSTKQRGAQKGMGLGLTTCRVVIQEHGGRIAIESRPAAGTTVTCFLPASRDDRPGDGA
jgi:PAS domain S-box-containing protein